MGKPREFPYPVTGVEEYLAAILAELRGLRDILSPRQAEVAPPDVLIHVTEPTSPPEKPTPPPLVSFKDAAKPAKPPAPRKRTTRKTRKKRT